MTSKADSESVVTEYEAGLLRISLDRPANGNAVTPGLIADLMGAVAEAEDPDVRAVLIAGSGANFCAGADLRHFAGKLDRVADELQEMATGFHAMLERLYRLPKPVVAAVQGSAIGAGFGLALATDLVVAGRSARFSTGYARLGLSADAGVSWFLTQALGPRQAGALLMTARFLGAGEAHSLGLIDEIVEDEALPAAAEAAAQAFAAGPGGAYAAIKALILLHAVNSGLGESAVAEIAAVLDRYIAYQGAARATLASGAVGPADLGARVADMRALRSTTLGPALAKAFYGDDAELADIEMRRQAILRNGSMTKDDRQRALAAIEAELPTEIIGARKLSSAPTALHLKVEALRASGAAADEIAALRRSEYGAGAAERLAMLDRSRETWSQRMTVYRSEEQGLRSTYGSPESASYRRALESLRQRHFSAAELVRVQALDAEGL